MIETQTFWHLKLNDKAAVYVWDLENQFSNLKISKEKEHPEYRKTYPLKQID